MPGYNTIDRYGSEELIIRRSRFIGYIKPVTTADDAVAFINEIRAKHRDATHNVYAYCLREGQLKRYSDDGEPQGTAGMPVLDVILKQELVDCCIVVTRYFGGVLLGAGGLVRAYSSSASAAVDAGEKIRMGLCSCIRIECDYNLYGKIDSMIPQHGGVVDNVIFTDGVCLEVSLPVEMTERFCAELVDVSCGRVKPVVYCEKYTKLKL